MQPDTQQHGQERRSFIEAARREQIVEAAIEVIAKVGYASASMARIAEHAGISRGLISYHFTGKDDLIAQVVVTVYSEGAAFMGPKIDAATTATGKLRAYIESNLDYMRAHPERMAAIVDVLSGGALVDGTLDIDLGEAERQSLAPLEELFERGLASGEFRPFDPTVMARAVRNVIDGIPPRITDADLDLELCARELTTLFDLATRNPRTTSDVQASSSTEAEQELA